MIREIGEERGRRVKNSELARWAGVTASSVTQWLSGDTDRIWGDVAATLEIATGYSAAWIAAGVGERKVTRPPPDPVAEEVVTLFALTDDFGRSNILMNVRAWHTARPKGKLHSPS